MSNKLSYTITKYLVFIAPVVILMITGFVLFHTLMLAVTFTLIIGVMGMIGLAFYVQRSNKFTEEINRKQKRSQQKVFEATMGINQKISKAGRIWNNLKRKLRIK